MYFVKYSKIKTNDRNKSEARFLESVRMWQIARFMVIRIRYFYSHRMMMIKLLFLEMSPIVTTVRV